MAGSAANPLPQPGLPLGADRRHIHSVHVLERVVERRALAEDVEQLPHHPPAVRVDQIGDETLALRVGEGGTGVGCDIKPLASID